MPWSQTPSKPVTAAAARNARTLRRSMTEPETRLWWHLRHRIPVAGSHFRRQVAIGRYVADFCCLSRHLIIEVDGGGHSRDDKATRDARRTADLRDAGFHLIRFTNAEVVRSIDGVLDTVHAALSPPPCGEGPGMGVVEPGSAPSSAVARDSGTHRQSGPRPRQGGTTPTPDPSPQGGGE